MNTMDVFILSLWVILMTWGIIGRVRHDRKNRRRELDKERPRSREMNKTN
jgi:hypothetical protein